MKREGYQLEPHLINTLNMMGYNNMHSLRDFGEHDEKHINEFMSKKFHLLLKNKFKDDEEKLNKELCNYYGPIWSLMPECYEVLGGYSKTLKAVSEKVRSIYCEKNLAAQSRGIKSSLSSVRSSVSSNASETMEETTQISKHLDERTKLSKVVNEWISKSDLANAGTSARVEEITITQDGMGSFIASIACPVCNEKCKVTKNRGRWTASNFYRHVERKHIVGAAKEVMKMNRERNAKTSRITLMTRFLNNKPCATTSSVSSGECPREDILHAEDIPSPQLPPDRAPVSMSEKPDSKNAEPAEIGGDEDGDLPEGEYIKSSISQKRKKTQLIPEEVENEDETENIENGNF